MNRLGAFGAVLASVACAAITQLEGQLEASATSQTNGTDGCESWPDFILTEAWTFGKDYYVTTKIRFSAFLIPDDL